MERIKDNELTSILDKIDDLDDRKSFRQVSKHFMKVLFIHQRYLRNWLPHLLYDILPGSPNLTTFCCLEPLSNSHMKLLAKSCPKLRFLLLKLNPDSGPGEFGFDFDDDGLCAVANACSDLVRVDISRRIHVGDVSITKLSRKKLRMINLDRCLNVGDESLKAIGEKTSLDDLVLRGCYLITDLGLKYLANGKLKNYLIHLDLSECDRISDGGIFYLKEMVTLKHLVLSKCGVNVTDTGAVALISKLRNIRILDLSWLINVTNISLFVIASKCLKLTDICLKGCEAITVNGLRAFAYHPTLNKLGLSSCHKLSWEDVKSVVFTCSELKHISLSSRIQESMPHNYFEKINDFKIDWK